MIQHNMPGSLHSDGEFSSDVVVEETKRELQLQFVNSTSVFAMTALDPYEVRDLASWLKGIADDMIRRRRLNRRQLKGG